MRIDQVGRAREAWPVLVRVAESKSTIFYRDLCAKLGLHPRAARYFLGVIQDYCRANGLPPLQAVAISLRTNKPGEGYAPDSGTSHEADLQRVYSHRYPNACPF